MKLLLDTHVIIWALSDSNKLPTNIKELILQDNSEIYVSAVSLWEIALKHKKAPDLFPYTASQIRYYCQRAGYIFLSVNLDNVEVLEKTSFKEHKDPFDLMLVSQSISNNMKLLTHDEKIKRCEAGFIEFF